MSRVHAPAGLLALVLALPGPAAWSQPADVRQLLPQAQAAGSGRLTFLGLEMYTASLWVGPGFRAADFASHPFVLELAYQRDFTSEAIAQRSIDEMRRAGGFNDTQAAQWQQALQASLPDVKRGDRIAGSNLAGGGAAFFTNGRPTGEIRDAQFARLFFGIWLGPQTSEPALRRALLAQAAP